MSERMQMQLKSCPFCGQEPNLRDYADRLAANGAWRIECDQCDVCLSTYYIDDGSKHSDKRGMLTLAVKNWNQRRLVRGLPKVVRVKV